MRLKFYLALLTIVSSFSCFAQVITIRGRITDDKTGAGIPGVSILSGSMGTSADDKGNFVFYVQQSVVEESGITASCIGYQTVHLTDFTDNFTLPMTPVVTELKPVGVSPDAEYLVKKAYRRIELNYLNTDFNITGMERMTHTLRDTFGYQYYYSNTSKIRIYMSPYTVKPAIAQVGLMEKNELIKRNPKALRIRFFDGYKLVLNHDFVHTGAIMLRGDTAKFRYKLNRKEVINGRKTYVVNFYSNIKEGDAGILYIDTASLAFVRILYTKHNVTPLNAIALDRVTCSAEYSRRDGGWTLDAVKFNSATIYKGYEVARSEDFQTAVLLNSNAAQIPADAVIVDRAIDEMVKPYEHFSAADKKIPADINKLIKKTFPKIDTPAMASQTH